jgi:hypothetical protein
MLPHGAQGSWEGSAIYLAKERRDTRIRVNAADPGYTATDFNAVRAGEVADFKSGAPAAGRGCPTARAESLGRSLRLTRGLVVAQALLATRLPGHCVLVTDGPFADTKEWIAGFDILECVNLDQAIDIAAKHPMARFGRIEIRPFWPEE